MASNRQFTPLQDRAICRHKGLFTTQWVERFLYLFALAYDSQIRTSHFALRFSVSILRIMFCYYKLI